MTTEVRSGTPLIEWEPCLQQAQPLQPEGVHRLPNWTRLAANTFQCRVRITEEAEGFSIAMPSLPGVVSQGDTQEEAIAHIKEAFQGVVESYREDNEEIPWTEVTEPADNATKELWIVVHV